LSDYTKLFDIVILGEPTYLIPYVMLAKIGNHAVNGDVLELLGHDLYKVIASVIG
jgi:hypothetical protein